MCHDISAESHLPGGARAAFTAGLWIAAIGTCFLLDEIVAAWVWEARPVMPHVTKRVMRAPGDFRFTLAVALVLGLLHRTGWRAGLLLSVSGVASGVMVVLAKWSAGRTRPFKGVPAHEFAPFKGGLVALFQPPPNLSFPSGDVCLAFATAACLGYWFPQRRRLLLLLASVVAAQRVLAHAHYLSDVVAGAALGHLAAFLTWRLAPSSLRGIGADNQPAPPDSPGKAASGPGAAHPDAANGGSPEPA